MAARVDELSSSRRSKVGIPSAKWTTRRFRFHFSFAWNQISDSCGWMNVKKAWIKGAARERFFRFFVLVKNHKLISRPEGRSANSYNYVISCLRRQKAANPMYRKPEVSVRPGGNQTILAFVLQRSSFTVSKYHESHEILISAWRDWGDDLRR